MMYSLLLREFFYEKKMYLKWLFVSDKVYKIGLEKND